VQKYGGSSVATIDKIQAIAEKIVATRAQGFDVVVVVSAMGNTTNELLGLAREVTSTPPLRELDMLLSAGERISMSVLSMAIQQLGVDAVSLTGPQCTILTTETHGSAVITEIRPRRILDELSRGRVVVVAGFQGVNGLGETTTLGRGGSDTTAVALAAALEARHCDIFSDVAGVYSADPRVVESARRLDELGYEEMQAFARYGARVLNADAVEFARRKGIEVYARSTFGGSDHTVIRKLDNPTRESGFGVAGVAGNDKLLRVHYDGSISAGPRTREIMDALEDYDILAGLTRDDQVDVLLSTENIPCDVTFARTLGEAFENHVEVSPEIGSVTAVGLGVGDNPEAIAYARRALENASVPLISSYTCPEAVTCVVRADLLSEGVRAVHNAFIEAPQGL
jgi:aspartate kinase